MAHILSNLGLGEILVIVAALVIPEFVKVIRKFFYRYVKTN